MAADEYFVTGLSIVMCLVCGALAWSGYRRTSEIFSPWTIFLGMAILDIYLPGALYFSVGLPVQAPWILPSTREAIAPAILLFTLGVLLFGWGYWTTGSGSRADHAQAMETQSHLRLMVFSPRRAYLVLGISGLMYAGKILLDILLSGSIGAYLSDRILVRFQSSLIPAEPGVVRLFSQMAQYMLPVFLTTIGTLVAHRRARSLLGSSILLVLGILAAMTTLFRGAILSFFIAIALVESTRTRDQNSPATGVAHQASRRPSRRAVQIFLTGVVLFLLLGGVRNFLVARAWQPQASIGEGFRFELQRIVRGEGLLGLASIFNFYPGESSFLGGKTFWDMLLLPVPRSIWPDKPEWYGIDDITRGMGWPPSTQSAVTMSGELYANFGYPGVLLMGAYGMVFGLFRRYRRGPRFRFLYAFVLVPMMLPTFWMAFSGLVNQLVSVPLVILGLSFIFPRSSRI